VTDGAKLCKDDNKYKLEKVMETAAELELKLLEYVSKNSHGDISKVTPQTLLFQEGVFDSMGFVLLIDFLEEKFAIKADDEDLIESNFESVSAISNFIQRKSSAVIA
jgi:acyl carrier protein